MSVCVCEAVFVDSREARERERRRTGEGEREKVFRGDSRILFAVEGHVYFHFLRLETFDNPLYKCMCATINGNRRSALVIVHLVSTFGRKMIVHFLFRLFLLLFSSSSRLLFLQRIA